MKIQSRLFSQRWLLIGLLVIAIAIVAALLISRSPDRQAPQVDTSPVTQGNIVATVRGSGTVEAERALKVAFQTAGTVVEVLVAAGDTVVAGEPLARLDSRELELQLAQSEANLETALAQLDQAREGNSTPEDIAAAQASVDNAAAQLDRTRSGNVTAADIASAEAAQRSAQAHLDDVLNGADAETIASAQSRVEQARATLAAQRSALSIAKTNAEAQIGLAANDLRNAQDEYSRIYWENREKEADLQRFGRELAQADKDREAQALRAVQNAEDAVVQAQRNYDRAVQDEISGLQQAEADLRDAEAQLAALEAGASEQEIIQARATVEQRAADLARLHAGGTAADIAAAQASLEQQQANLDRLTAPASTSDLRIREAAVAQAQQSVDQAELQLSYATLTAPFDGVISRIDIVPGSVVGTSSAVLSLVDRESLQVELRLSENDVAQVAVGQTVDLRIDALDDLALPGTVAYIAPAAEDSAGVVTYAVEIAFDEQPAQLRVGMSASLDIEVARKEDVLLVPTTALLPRGSEQIVQVLEGESLREVVVATGLSDGQYTEIRSGLAQGDRVVTLPSIDVVIPSRRLPLGSD